MGGTKTIASLGEFGLIERLKRMLPPPPGDILGIGDDCAVLPLDFAGAAAKEVLSVDVMVEGHHFRSDTTDPRSLGFKVLATAVSDIAAMGGSPRGAFLTMLLRGDIALSWFDELGGGLAEACDAFSCPVLGGDTTAAEQLSFGVTVMGHCDGAPLLRSGAKDGDDIWVTGSVGDSGIGLHLLEHPENARALEKERAEYFRLRHLRPMPRLAAGRVLRENGLAHAAIDVSDGLLQDLLHISRASHVVVSVDLDRVPCARSDLLKLGRAPLDAAQSGEDYELCFTAAAGSGERLEELDAGVTLTAIGKCRSCGKDEVPVVEVYSGKKLVLEIGRGGEISGGFRHF